MTNRFPDITTVELDRYAVEIHQKIQILECRTTDLDGRPLRTARANQARSEIKHLTRTLSEVDKELDRRNATTWHSAQRLTQTKPDTNAE